MEYCDDCNKLKIHDHCITKDQFEKLDVENKDCPCNECIVKVTCCVCCDKRYAYIAMLNSVALRRLSNEIQIL